MRSPGFVFWGLFLIIGLIILCYIVWMRIKNRSR